MRVGCVLPRLFVCAFSRQRHSVWSHFARLVQLSAPYRLHTVDTLGWTAGEVEERLNRHGCTVHCGAALSRHMCA